MIVVISAVAKAKTEKIATLEFGWVLAQDKEQGRCVMQSPPMRQKDGTGVMLINLKSADPDTLIFTFMNPTWDFTYREDDEEGYLEIHTEEHVRSSLEVSAMTSFDTRKPIWWNYHTTGLDMSYSVIDGRPFATASQYSGRDGELEDGTKVNLLTLLTDPKYSSEESGWVLEFSNQPQRDRHWGDTFVVPLWAIPNLRILTQCIK